MQVLDLFSGIGGFSLGLERAGFETVAFCEIEPYCQAVLKKHWPDVPIYNDVRKLDGKEFRGVDLVCGGYPCQPFSTAGKQKGSADERHLWPEMFRIIREARPRWVIAENVRGHVRLGFDEVALQLENDGFTVWPFIIPACAVDAPHRRERLWIVGYSGGSTGQRHTGSFLATQEGIGSAGEQNGDLSERFEYAGTGSGERPMAATESEQNRRLQSSGFQPNVGTSSEDVAYSEKQGLESSGNEKRHESPLTGLEYNGKANRENHWTVEPGICRVVNGFPGRVDRLKALGNAVVPQIPEIIGRAIMQYEKGATS